MWVALAWVLVWGPYARADAPRIGSVRVTGNRAFSAGAVLSWLVSKPGRPFEADGLSEDVDALLKHYQDAGYWLASVETVASSGATGTDILVRITEGPLCLVGRIEVRGSSALDRDRVLALMDTRVGQPLVQRTFEADLEQVLRWYENHGYPFCAIQVGDLSLEGTGSLLVSLDINEGPRILLHEIRVTGNKLTRDAVIVRELGVELGEAYEQRRVDAGYRRLSRLDFLEAVEPPQVLFDPHRERGVLEVHVREARANHVSGAVGYVPESGARAGYFTGLFELALRNLWGTGRAMDAAWRRNAPEASELCLGYKEPWVLGRPLNAGVAFEHRQRARYTVTRLRVDVTAPFSAGLVAQGSVVWERSVPDSLGAFLMPRSRTTSAALEVRYDTRDSPGNPRKGVYYRTSAEVGFKRNRAVAGFSPEKRKARRGSYAAHLEHFLPLGRRQVLALALHGAQVTTDEPAVPLSEKLFLGGATTLRGYREEQFEGVQTAWANLEYRVLLSGGSRIFGFVDGGYFHDERDRRAQGLGIAPASTGKMGYGVGVRAESRMGILGVDFGLGEGDKLPEGKIHASLINRF